MTQQKDSAPEWVKEEMYFGNGTYPSWTIYRRSGNRIQVQGEWETAVAVEDDRLEINLEELTRRFLGAFEECTVSISKGYTASDGRIEKPRAWLLGWKELTTPEELERYEQDKRFAMRGPNDTF